MRNGKPPKFRATFIFILPSRYKATYGPEPFRLGKYRFEYVGEPNGPGDTYPRYSRKRKRPSPLADNKPTDRFSNAKDVEPAVERSKKEITFHATIEYVPYPSEWDRDDSYRDFVGASLKALERKSQEERRRAGEG